MDAPELIHNFGTGCALIGSILAWAYVALYYRRSWREYETGRHQLTFSVGLAVIFSWISYRAFMGSEVQPMRDELIRIGVYLFIIIMFVWDLRLLRKYKHMEKEGRDGSEGPVEVE